jgi:RNA recognition motif-containing protein
MRKLINNVYIKNIPKGWTYAEVHDLFSPFGNIKSLFLQEHEKFGQFGFVCYDDEKGINKEYGPECVEKAIQELNDRDFGTGLRLIVKHALKKADRTTEKLRETMRYKASKRRCNLYVRNFPSSYTETDIINLFKQYGEIERVRVEHKNPSSFAFVCFKEPTDAGNAKQNLHNYEIEGKMLVINYYEIKEIRQI